MPAKPGRTRGVRMRRLRWLMPTAEILAPLLRAEQGYDLDFFGSIGLRQRRPRRHAAFRSSFSPFVPSSVSRILRARRA